MSKQITKNYVLALLTRKAGNRWITPIIVEKGRKEGMSPCWLLEGRATTNGGYVQISSGLGKVYVHRLVLSAKLGREVDLIFFVMIGMLCHGIISSFGND